MTKDTTGRFSSAPREMTDEQRDAICYKSKLLNKYFDSYDDLVAAEDEYNKAHAAELAAKAEKKAKADKVQEAYRHYLDVCERANKEINEAKNAYYQARNSFISEFGSYHMTYTRNGSDDELSVSDIFNEAFKDFFRIW